MRSPGNKFSPHSWKHQRELTALDDTWLKQNQVFGRRKLGQSHNADTTFLASHLRGAITDFYETAVNNGAFLIDDYVRLGEPTYGEPLYAGVELEHVALRGVKYGCKLRKPIGLPISYYSHHEDIMIPKNDDEPPLISGKITSFGLMREPFEVSAERIATKLELETASRLFLQSVINFGLQSVINFGLKQY